MSLVSSRWRIAAALTPTALCAAIVALSAPAHAQTVIFDNSDSPTYFSSRFSGEAPLAGITVAADTTITAIAVENDLSSNGNLRFAIYENPNVNTGPVYLSSAKAFVDDGDSFKMSDLFSYTLLAGNQYYIGAIADVDANWAFDLTYNTQNGITSDANGNHIDFAAPTFEGPAGADVRVRLYGGAAATAVPEPSEYAVGGMFGATLLFGMVRARRKKPTAA